ncbi:MAG: SPFH domain-containing protein [Gemmatimonadetes bacterium]|nr:SPFH domain-containing protein [Gemmatimonadota bacterium]
MGLLEKLRGELVDIVEWIDHTQDTLVWRFPRYHNQIKHGAALIVRPGQVAIFVHRGELADVFEPGHYELNTDNLPILSTLQGWKYGFDSPFKSEVYFVSTRQITDLKWGTPNPVMLRDPEFGPIRLRAFGTYAMRATNPKALLTELVGTDAVFEADEINELIRSMITSSFADLIGQEDIAALDLAANYMEMSQKLRKNVVEKVDDEYGLDIPQLFIVNISFPEEVEKALDKRTSMSVIGDMRQFQAYQMGEAMTRAADNPSGGGAADGMGLGMGFAMANQMMQQAGAPLGTVPPPPPPVSVWHIAENGQTRGPFTLSQLMQAIQSGQVSAQTLVWTTGMSGWETANSVPALAGQFASPPPPPPPPVES